MSISKMAERADLGARWYDGKPRPDWVLLLYWAVTAGLFSFFVWGIATALDRFHNIENAFSFLLDSFAYYFGTVFGMGPALPSTAFDRTDWVMTYSPLGNDWDVIGGFFKTWGELIIQPFNMLDHLTGNTQTVTNALRVILVLLLAAPLVWFLFKDYFKSDKQLSEKTGTFKSERRAKAAARMMGKGWDHYEDPNKKGVWRIKLVRKVGDKTLPLQLWDKFFCWPFRWSLDFVLGYFRFFFGYWNQPDPKKNGKHINRRPWLWKIFLVLALYYYNGFAIVVDYYGYYFLFFSSFDGFVLLKWLAMMAALLWPFMASIPSWGWVIICYLIFDKIRVKQARKTEERLHKKNIKPAKKSATASHQGPPGSGKTAGGTMEARDCEEDERDYLGSVIYDVRSWFPRFPWLQYFELEKKTREDPAGQLANTADAIDWADRIHADRFKLLAYFSGAKETVFDGTRIITLKDAMEQGARAYILYSIRHPLLASNLRIACVCDYSDPDVILPSFDYKLFKTDFKKYPEKIQSSFILDENSWKLRRTIPGTDPSAQGDVEGIVYYLQEFNKIYRNRLDPSCAFTSSDGIKDALAYIRHYCTIWNRPTAHWIVDLQRRSDCPDSIMSRIEADKAVKMTAEEWKNCLPLWVYTRAAMELEEKIYRSFDRRYRGHRDDESLLYRLMTSIHVLVFSRYTKRRGLFDYKLQSVRIQYHTSEASSTGEDVIRYLIKCDVFGDRYSTDADRDQVNARRESSHHSFTEPGQWQGRYPTAEETEKRNTYEWRDVDAMIAGDSVADEKKKKGSIKL